MSVQLYPPFSLYKKFMTHISNNFIQHIAKQINNPNQLDTLLEYCKIPLRKSIRVNRLKTTVEHFVNEWHQAGYQLIPIPWCEDGFWIDESVKALPAGLGNFLPHLQGCFYIQEASSMLPVTALLATAQNPQMILDVAAAPGSKTTQIAAMVNNHGLIIANELSSSRLKGLYSNIQRCGVTNVCLTHADGRIFGEKTEQTFDAILLDAPCGGEGTVRKDPDALSNWSLESVLTMSALQKELIVSAFKALKPGGTLVYSTCTLSFEENQWVCQHLIDEYPGEVKIVGLNNLFKGAEQAVTEEGYLHVYPHIFDSEGFFVACFTKSSHWSPPQEELSIKSHTKPFPFSPIDKKTATQFAQYAKQLSWNIQGIEKDLWLRKNEIWYFPAGIEKLIGKIKMDRMGVKLCESHKHGFKLQHQAAISFSNHFTLSYPLNKAQAVEYYQGKDIFVDDLKKFPKGEIIVCYQSQTLGIAKNLGNKLKNSLPRELVRDNPFAQLNESV